MAEDAVRAAMQLGVTFEPELDALNRDTITALFIIHAGRGAEEVDPLISKAEIWSHKWNLRTPIEVAPGLFAATYLTVPHDCKVGVCCHELGHLAFQWQDFYDPNGSDDGTEWAGTGHWDLMAGGSWNGSGTRPAHPSSLHKAQHGWIDVETVAFATGNPSEFAVEIKPITAVSSRALRLVSPHYENCQYLLLENRSHSGFDSHLPGEGLLVWRVDESGELFAPWNPGLLLIQADGLHELEKNWDKGDAGDPFPGSSQRTRLGPTGDISTTFPGRPSSGITLSNIRRNGITGVISLRVRYNGS
jgi:immune inhibitor A